MVQYNNGQGADTPTGKGTSCPTVRTMEDIKLKGGNSQMDDEDREEVREIVREYYGRLHIDCSLY